MQMLEILFQTRFTANVGIIKLENDREKRREGQRERESDREEEREGSPKVME